MRPGWILALVLVAVFTTGCFTIMAPWQLDKSDTVAHRNDLIDHAFSTPAVSLDDVQAPGAMLDSDDEWREVTVRGRYLNDHEVQLRNRVSGVQSGDQLVTPFQVNGTETVILVNRGSVGSEGSSSTDVAAPTGQATIHARLRTPETTTQFNPPRIADGELVAYSIDPGPLSDATGLALAPYYLELMPAQPGSLGEIALPSPDGLPHLSYGVQWLVFGVLAPLALVAAAWSSVKNPRSSTPAEPVAR